MLRTFQGVVLGLITQGAGHLLLTWPFQAHLFPPNAWHLLPFALGGLVCGLYARWAIAGLLVGLPYAALVVLWDAAVDPGVSAAAMGLALVGLGLGTTTCGLLARRRRARAESPTSPPPGEPPYGAAW